jgi:hypothetical protein
MRASASLSRLPIAKPIPRVPPVMRATRPEKFIARPSRASALKPNHTSPDSPEVVSRLMGKMLGRAFRCAGDVAA